MKNKLTKNYRNESLRNNNDCTTGKLLDFVYFKKNYKLIAMDSSKQTKLKDPQQISLLVSF